jgi:hypothetical protein
MEVELHNEKCSFLMSLLSLEKKVGASISFPLFLLWWVMEMRIFFSFPAFLLWPSGACVWYVVESGRAHTLHVWVNQGQSGWELFVSGRTRCVDGHTPHDCEYMIWSGERNNARRINILLSSQERGLWAVCSLVATVVFRISSQSAKPGRQGVVSRFSKTM